MNFIETLKNTRTPVPTEKQKSSGLKFETSSISHCPLPIAGEDETPEGEAAAVGVWWQHLMVS